MTTIRQIIRHQGEMSGTLSRAMTPTAPSQAYGHDTVWGFLQHEVSDEFKVMRERFNAMDDFQTAIALYRLEWPIKIAIAQAESAQKAVNHHHHEDFISIEHGDGDGLWEQLIECVHRASALYQAAALVVDCNKEALYPHAGLRQSDMELRDFEDLIIEARKAQFEAQRRIENEHQQLAH